MLFRPRAATETPDEWLAAARKGVLEAPRARSFARREFELLTKHYLLARYGAQAPEGSTVVIVRELARQVMRGKAR